MAKQLKARPVVLIVTGCRDWTDHRAIRKRLERFRGRNVVLFHGQCPYGGADGIADEIGRELGFDVRPMPADFGLLGKRAGPIRNGDMVEAALREAGREKTIHLLAFWDGESRGTKDCHEQAVRAGINASIVAKKEPH